MTSTASNAESASAALLLYGHPRCPQVPPVKGMLNRAHVPFTYINIHQDAAAAERVRAINNGNESVPTLVFADGSSLTEPSVGELKARLEALGYKVGPLGWLLGHGWKIAVIAAVIFAVVRALGWL